MGAAGIIDLGSGKRQSFGRTAQDRPLQAKRIGDPGASRVALVVGSIHGDETEGHRIVDRLRSAHSRARDAQIWLVRTVNRDGVKLGTRKNARSVDLNRNFGHRWSGAEPPSSGYYAGPRPFSEPESRAVRRLVRRLEPDVTVWYHQPWGMVLGCGQGNAVQRRYARLARMEFGCRGAGLTGTATGWQNHRGQGNAFVVELHQGRLGRRAVRRHARAVVAVARSGSGNPARAGARG